ncbi:MAG: hypothetical protein V4819_19150 [Verrucomicrobiota bacterium]
MSHLTLEKLNASLAECGCCEHPRCCPPLIECQSGFGRSKSVGFINDGTSDDRSDSGFAGVDWKQTRYLKKTYLEVGSSPADTVTDYPGGSSGSYTSRTLAVDWEKRFIEEYDQGFRASASGAYFSGSACDSTEETYSYRCEASGGWTETVYEAYFSAGAWHNRVGTIKVGVIEDIGGAPNPDYPGTFYPPCTLKTTLTETVHSFGVPGSPSTLEFIPGFLPAGPFTTSFIYENEVTFEDWVSLVETWLASRMNFDAAEDSGSDGCAPGALCQATKTIYDYSSVDFGQSAMDTDWFRFRIKHNKCCAYTDLRSEWDRVFYSREWLEWFAEVSALTGSDPRPEEPAKPGRTPQVWTWTGTPPRCDDSASDSAPLDPYDDETMWSPWSLVISMPDGVEGSILNRNYQQKCYGTVPDWMPGVFGTYDPSESI